MSTRAARSTPCSSKGTPRVVPGRELQVCGWSHPALVSCDGSLPLAASPQAVQYAPCLGPALMLLVNCLWLKEVSFAAPAESCVRAGAALGHLVPFLFP